MILVTHFPLSKVNVLKCSVVDFMVPLYGFYLDQCLDMFCVAWHKALIKVWNVPPQTHNKTIALLSDSVSLNISLKYDSGSLQRRLFAIKNIVINYVKKIAGSNPGRLWEGTTEICALTKMF